MQILEPGAVKLTGILGFGELKAPPQVWLSAGLNISITFLLSFPAVTAGLFTTLFFCPSNPLPKYWKTVEVESTSKSNTVLHPGAGGSFKVKSSR